MEGRIHSIESFGTVDGPGIRFVVFLQGCPLRCQYCHNPDTWDQQGGQVMTAPQVLERFDKNKMFYQKGGITATGGEPLLQLDFVTELFALCKKKNIHTCLDTSGCTFRMGDADYLARLDALLAVTDLVMLDLKIIDKEKHRALTGADNKGILAFARYVSQKEIPLWIRHVCIPGVTDGEEDLQELGAFMATLPTVKALDVLPYHTLGVNKYEELGITYPLQGVSAATKQQANQAKTRILEEFKLKKQKQ
ncbi:MAG: pyruvate formate lyase-activating protein [Clostridia bacterium]|nr:pyruvate formate lyase-activating protein [Clostridia bacterium]